MKDVILKQLNIGKLWYIIILIINLVISLIELIKKGNYIIKIKFIWGRGIAMDTELFNSLFLTQKMVDNLVENSLNNYDQPIWIKNREGRYLAVNDTSCEFLGIDRETILNSTHNDFFEQETFEPIQNNNIEVMDTKQRRIINERLYIREKEIVMHTHKIPIIQSDGSCNSFLGHGRIVHESLLEYGNIIADDNDNLAYDLIIDNKTKRQKNLDREIFEYMKDIYEALELKGISLWRYNDDSKTLKKQMSLGVAKNILDNYEYEISNKEEEFFVCRSKGANPPTLVNFNEEIYEKAKVLNEYKKQLKNKYIISSPVVVDGDRILGIVNLYFDMPLFTEQIDKYIKRICSRIALTIKNVELSNEVMAHLKDKIKLEKLLSRYLNLAVDLCLIIDNTGKIKKMSSSILRLLGWSTKEIIDIPLEKFLRIKDNKISLEALAQVYNKKCYGGISTLQCKNGDLKHIEWYYYNDRDNNETIITGQDVTDTLDLKEKTRELEEKIQQEKFKSRFLSNVSHEFKTPINILMSSIQLQLSQYNDMKESELKNNSNYKQLQVMKQNSYRLFKLVNNLIDITKIDGHHVNLQKRNLNIVYFIEDIVESISNYLSQANRNIIFDTSDEEIILGFDPNAMERIILNIISNSIKFTDDNGNIFISIKKDDKEEKVYVSVKDDGIGISEEAADIVFDRFSQVDDLLTRRSEGSGIGLAIVKSFTELHGGEVFLNKDLDKGTEITIGLPIKKVDSSEEQLFQDKVLDSRGKKFEIEFSDIYMDCS